MVRKASNEGGTNGNNTMVMGAALGIQEVVQWWKQGYEVLGFNLATETLQDTLIKVPTTVPLVFGTHCQIFMRCSVFNDPSVCNWDMSRYKDMNYMFYEAHAFNQPIGDWDVSNVRHMESMFFNAHAFNQDLTHWCVTNIASEPASFRYGSALTDANCPVWGTCPQTEGPVLVPIGNNT